MKIFAGRSAHTDAMKITAEGLKKIAWLFFEAGR
jgi:hypothetical protein